MDKAKAQTVANSALELLNIRPSIPYVLGKAARNGADCQGFVELCIAEADGKADYSGSNAMYRACVNAGAAWPSSDQSKWKPGALLFEVVKDGKESDKYKSDGLGNAAHVAVMVLASDNIWGIDASASAGCVRSRNKRDALSFLNYVGYLPEIDYDETITTASSFTVVEPASPYAFDMVNTPPIQQTAPPPVTPSVYPFDVRVTASSVNLRQKPSTSATLVRQAAQGSMLTVYDTQASGGRIWGQTHTEYGDKRIMPAWFDMQFTERVAPEPPLVEDTAPPAIQPAPAKPDVFELMGKVVDMAERLSKLD